MRKLKALFIAAGILVCGIAATQGIFAAEEGYADADTAKLLAVLPNAKLSLADGIKQAAKDKEVPISGKFELDDNGKLSLSVYTAEKGLSVLPEKNILKELAGSPEQAAWVPESEVFKDVEHVARSSQHLILNALSHLSLLAIVEDASKHASGIVYSINPTLHGRKAAFEVLVANKDKVSKLTYDIPSGKFLGSK
ncbi:MAG: hypothetical protein HY067_23155 [Betaproteobacteria bacterium]|nr:hypothetical protein [Betaproteobacteria bacterium]